MTLLQVKGVGRSGVSTQQGCAVVELDSGDGVAVGGDAGGEVDGGGRVKAALLAGEVNAMVGGAKDDIRVDGLVREVALQIRAVVGRGGKVVGCPTDQVGNGRLVALLTVSVLV